MRKSLKRLTLILLALVIVFSMSACGKKGKTDAPTISAFTIDADTGATRGKLNEAHKLNWTITGDCTRKEITVKKGDPAADATESDYAYVEQAQKITFKTEGLYTVTLEAFNDAKSTAKSVTINITDFTAPVIQMPVSTSVEKDTAVDFAPTVTYDTGDSKLSDQITVTLDLNPATADTDYTVGEGKFTPKKEGTYMVTYEVTSVKGKSNSATWTLISTPVTGNKVVVTAGTTSATKEGEFYLLEKNTATVFGYEVQNYTAENFNVTAELKKGAEAKGTASVDTATRKVTVTAPEAGEYTLTVTVAHKSDATNTSSAVWKLKVKEETAAGLVLGSDPFGGTWTQMIPKIGMLLYYDATYNGNPVAASSVTYRITSGSNIASIQKVNNNDNYRYLIATATGSVTVEMTVTVSGAEAKTATKTFTVGAGEATETHDKYFKSVYKGAYENVFNDADSGVWVGYADGVLQGLSGEVVIATKYGVIYDYALESAPINFWMEQETSGNRNFKIEFDLTPLAVVATSGVGFSVFNGTAHLGNLGLNWTSNDNTFNGWIDNALNGTAGAKQGTISVAANTTYKIKFEKAGAKWSVSVNGTEYITSSGTDKQISFLAMRFWNSGKVLIENISVERS